ncbi:MAG: hypothetical protein AAB370_01490 [Verrucomicrobiota bacterium]
MKRLVIVIFFGALVFFIGHVASAIIRSDHPDAPDSADRYGFPFLVFAEAHYHDPHPYFNRAALWANVGFALLISGLVVRAVSKILKPPGEQGNCSSPQPSPPSGEGE